jgi:poly(hydroxyalkanoate) granule-associated protein
MAAKKSKRAKAKASQPKNLFINSAHQIWLAGLGALARAQKEGPKLFETLVEEGEKVHSRTVDAAGEAMSNAMQGIRGTIDASVEGVRDRATETWDNIEKIFQSRVHKAMRQLGVPTADDISTLSRKVNELTKSVEALARKRSAPARAASGRRAQRPEVRAVTLERTKPVQHNA